MAGVHPQIVGDHDYRVAARSLIFIRAETASERRIHPEFIEEIGGDDKSPS